MDAINRYLKCCGLVIFLFVSSCGGSPTNLSSITPTHTSIPVPTSSPTPLLVPTPNIQRTPIPTFPTNEPFGIVGQIGGPTQAVAVNGNLAYVGIGSRLIILDISSPDLPVEIGSTPPLGSEIQDIAVVGNMAYLAAGGSGLYIVDVSVPDDLIVIGHHDSPGYSEGVSVVNSYAFLADGPAGVQVIDIADPTRPTEVSFAYKLNYAFDVVADGDFAFVAAAGAGLLVADISNPLEPRQISSLDTPGYAFGVALSRDTVYVADGWSGVQIVDVSDPTHLKNIGSYESQGWTFDVLAEENIVYIADAFNGLQILDMSIPTESMQIGYYSMPGSLVRHLALHEGMILIASRNSGLNILDVGSPAQPKQIARYSPLGYADDVFVADAHAYLAAGPYGLRIVDVSIPSQPREVGAYETEGYATGVVAQGEQAFVITSSTAETPAGMHILDVADPTHPGELAFIAVSGTPQDIVIENDIAYIANEFGLLLIDVSQPSAPAQLSELTFTRGVDASWGVAFADQKAYVTHSDSGLKIVDVSDPQTPSLMGVYDSDTVKRVMAVAVHGDFAYVTDVVRLHVLDISNPSQPTEAGFYDLPVTAERVAVTGDRLYIADSAGGLVILDVSDPRQPVLAGWRRLPGYAFGLSVTDQHIFVADGESGLFIIEDTASSQQSGMNSPHQTGGSKNHGESGLSLLVDFSYSRITLGPQPVSLKNGYSSPSVSSSIPSALQPGTNTLTVTSTGDNGPGTLRWALENATSGTTILFDPQVFDPNHPGIIYPSTGLPDLQSGNVTIDASNAGVILDGSQSPPCTVGLKIRSDGNTIMGLQIVSFSCDGIVIESGSNNVIGGDRSRGGGPLGEGNLISGNGFAGIEVKGVETSNNRIAGNYIGTDLASLQPLGRQTYGVYIASGTGYMIGGTTPAEGNVISGNEIADINLTRQASRNTVIGNYIGIDASGRKRLGNMGVLVDVGSFNNTIQDNVIGNSLIISDWGSWGNEVIGNLIGVDATGTLSLGGTETSLAVNASFNRVGGTEPGERNIISGDGSRGIKIGIWGTSDVFILGNYVGTDITGTKRVGSYTTGITIYESGAHHIFIGGFDEAERNVISASLDKGISLEGVGSDYNFILGNYIGTDASGSEAIPNHGGGVAILGGDHNYLLGNLIHFIENGGISIVSGDYNLIHHNMLLQTGASLDGGRDNAWDDGSEGNYWSDYSGMDANEDGIGDIPFLVLPNGVDGFPLMEQIPR